MLVRRRRGIEGLTQQQLAVMAFGAETSKARISELENGHVAGPQQRIIDAITVALNLSPNDLDACYSPAVPPLTEDFVGELGLAADLVTALSWGFAATNPQATASQFQAYLRQKASELGALQRRSPPADFDVPGVTATLERAKAAIGEGRFDEAHEILASEEVQRKRIATGALEALLLVRALRGDAELLRDNSEAAFGHYSAAANYLKEVDPLEAAARRHSFHQRMMEHGYTHAGRSLELSAVLLEENIEFYASTGLNFERARSENNLGVLLYERGQWTSGRKGVELVQQAIVVLNASLKVRTYEHYPSNWAATQNNVGLALWHEGTRTRSGRGDRSLAASAECFKAAQRVYKREQYPWEWARIQNNLGLVFRAQGERRRGVDGMTLLQESVVHFRIAHEVYSEHEFPDDWGMTMNNLAHALVARSKREPPINATGTVLEAVDACKNALRVRHEDKHPIRWARTQYVLAQALEQAGKLMRSSRSEYYQRAINAIDHALSGYHATFTDRYFRDALALRRRLMKRLDS